MWKYVARIIRIVCNSPTTAITISPVASNAGIEHIKYGAVCFECLCRGLCRNRRICVIFFDGNRRFCAVICGANEIAERFIGFKIIDILINSTASGYENCGHIR